MSRVALVSPATAGRITMVGGVFALPFWVMYAWAPAAPAWVIMASIAVAMFYALKVLTLAGYWREAISWRGAAYVAAWPGLNAPEFIGRGRVAGVEPLVVGEVVAALLKLLLGLGLILWATANAWAKPGWLVGWVGMIGLIFTLHFGAMHLASLFWRWVGLHAPPIMKAPVRAVSLAEFWSERWNVAFADVARRFLFRPLARRCGALKAGGVVFLVSGVVHELVISLPARGGWGGPTVYFVLQAAGIAGERSRAGKRCGLADGWRGRLWVFGFTALPLPLLFHAPFVERVIVPMFKDFAL